MAKKTRTMKEIRQLERVSSYEHLNWEEIEAGDAETREFFKDWKAVIDHVQAFEEKWKVGRYSDEANEANKEAL